MSWPFQAAELVMKKERSSFLLNLKGLDTFSWSSVADPHVERRPNLMSELRNSDRWSHSV